MSRIVAIVAPISRPHTCQLSLQNVSPEIYESKCIASHKLINLTARNLILSRSYSPHHFAFKMHKSETLNGFSHLQNIALLKFLLANKCQVLLYYQEYWAFFGN